MPPGLCGELALFTDGSRSLAAARVVPTTLPHIAQADSGGIGKRKGNRNRVLVLAQAAGCWPRGSSARTQALQSLQPLTTAVWHDKVIVFPRPR